MINDYKIHFKKPKDKIARSLCLVLTKIYYMSMSLKKENIASVEILYTDEHNQNISVKFFESRGYHLGLETL